MGKDSKTQKTDRNVKINEQREIEKQASRGSLESFSDLTTSKGNKTTTSGGGPKKPK